MKLLVIAAGAVALAVALKGDPAITYAKDIAPIIQKNCQPCHRPGQVAPFTLMNYEETKTWAQEIRQVTTERLMPPWKPEPGFGSFKHERRLENEEIKAIAKWVDDGCPMGDLRQAPAPVNYSEGWSLGKPDFIAEMAEEYEVAATGEDEYRHFVIPTNFDKDVFVRALDVQPGNRKTVHHVVVFIDQTGIARKLDERDPGPGYKAFGSPGFPPTSILGTWAPGFSPAESPNGTGYRIPKGADIVMQVHYYRTGKAERDRSKMALYFSQAADPKEVFMRMAINMQFRIPPGEERHPVVARQSIFRDSYLVGILPHMHLLGKEMKITAKLPGKTDPLPLIWIKNWDFNWQDTYYYQQPILLPAGTEVIVEAVYDNSSKNPRNPHNPPKAVGWGEKTTDEMCLAFLHFLPASAWKPAE